MTTHHLFSLSTGLLLSLAAVRGAIADTVDQPCAMMGTYQTLLNANKTGGCTISVGGVASVTVKNFEYTPGADAPAASAVGYTLLNGQVTDPNGQPLYGFDFNPVLPVGASLRGDEDLAYTVVPMGTTLTSAELQTNELGGIATVTENLKFCLPLDPYNTSGNCGHTFPSIVVGNQHGQMLQQDVSFAPWTSMTVNKDINCIDCTDISFVRDGFDVSGVVKTSSVLEPTTYGLVSIGFLAIAYFSRCRTAR